MSIKILWLSLTNIPAGSYHIQFLSHLYRHLKKCNQITIVSNNDIVDRKTRLPVKKTKEIDFSGWDVILVQENESLLKVQKRLQKLKIPIIFFSHETTPDNQPIFIDNLVKVVVTHKLPLREGLWSSVRVNQPYFKDSLTSQDQKKEFNENRKFKILIVHSLHDVDLISLRSFTYFANNYLFENEVTILLSSQLMVAQNRGFVNSNVKLLARSEFEPGEILGFDLVIAAERDCVHSICHGIPTMVAGPRGFGGLVNENDVEQYLGCNFGGRLGGELGEAIPYWVMVDEFDLFHSDPQKAYETAQAVKLKLNALLSPELILPIIEAHIVKVAMTRRNVTDTTIPVVGQGIKFFPVSESADEYIIHNEVGLAVGVISISEKNVLALCDGSRDLSQTAAIIKTGTNELIPFCIDLWLQNIITFREK